MNKFVLIRNKKYFTFESNCSFEEIKEQLDNIQRTLWKLTVEDHKIKLFNFHNISIGTYDICTLYLLENWFNKHLVK